MSLCYCDMRSVEARCFPRGLKQLCLDHSIVPLGWFDSLRQEAFFPKLLELSLTYCTRISDKDLASVSRFLRTLQHLDLSHCYRVGDTGVQSITANLKELTYLDLSNCPGITDLSLHHIGRHLVHLKYLNLLCCRQVTDAGVNSLVHSLSSLESLVLASCPEITNNALNAITESCKRLKHLNISDCFQLTDSGVDSVKTLLPDCRVTGPWTAEMVIVHKNIGQVWQTFKYQPLNLLLEFIQSSMFPPFFKFLESHWIWISNFRPGKFFKMGWFFWQSFSCQLQHQKFIY